MISFDNLSFDVSWKGLIFIKNEGIHTAIQEHLSGAAGTAGTAGAAATEKAQPIEAATTSAPAKAKARVKAAVSEPKADKPKADKPKADKPKADKPKWIDASQIKQIV